MTIDISHTVRQNKTLYEVMLLLSIFLAVWYIAIHQKPLEQTLFIRQIWGSSYQVFALIGGIIGLTIANRWGRKGMIGKSLIFFSLGLLLQSLGQTLNSYYNFFENAVIPYPSLGDIGFMGSVVAYIIGSSYLLKMTGLKLTIRSIRGKALVIGLPLAVLVLCYSFFLQGYEFDFSNKIRILLDFGYPLGQATYVTISLLAYLLSRNYIGGMLKGPTLFLIFALIFQYSSDFTFLYQASVGTWYVGGINDFMYFLSYTLMAFALVQFGSVYKAMTVERLNLND